MYTKITVCCVLWESSQRELSACPAAHPREVLRAREPKTEGSENSEVMGHHTFPEWWMAIITFWERDKTP